jgi:hypothetical protein
MWQKIEWPKKREQNEAHKALFRKLEIKPHERHRKSKVNSGVLEGPAVPVPLEEPVVLFILNVQWFVINGREYRRANQKWTGNMGCTSRKQTKQKHNIICVGHHCEQISTNNVKNTLPSCKQLEVKTNIVHIMLYIMTE